MSKDVVWKIISFYTTRPKKTFFGIFPVYKLTKFFPDPVGTLHLQKPPNQHEIGA